jgi:peroxiredoxin
MFNTAGWGRIEGAKDSVQFASDVGLAFSKGVSTPLLLPLLRPEKGYKGKAEG